MITYKSLSSYNVLGRVCEGLGCGCVLAALKTSKVCCFRNIRHHEGVSSS